EEKSISVSDGRRDKGTIYRRINRRIAVPYKPGIVGTGLGADAQTRERRDAVGVELYVQDEPRDVSCVSGLLPEASTSRADHLGKARCVFRCCRGPLLQTRYAPGRGSYPRRWSQSARDKFS